MKKLVLVLLACCASALMAQEGAMIQIRTLCFQRGADAPDKLIIVKPDSSVVEMGLSSTFPSQKTRVPVVNGKVVFYAQGNLTSPAAIASMPSGTGDVLVLLISAPASKKPLVFDTVVIDMSKNGFPDDGAVIMNAYPNDVRVVIGEHRILLKPGMRKALARPTQRNEFNMAQVVIQYSREADWRTAVETLVSFPPELKQLFIAYSEPGSNRVTMRSYKINL